MLDEDFLDQFRDCEIAHLQPLINQGSVVDVLKEIKRLRTTDQNIYLRNGSINRVNGIIGMNFSCDGAHYIDHKTFFEKLETFATPEIDVQKSALAVA